MDMEAVEDPEIIKWNGCFRNIDRNYNILKEKYKTVRYLGY